jgi:transposase-like protein
MKCLLTDRAGLTAYLRCPAEHHKRIRHSNFIERTFGVTRRRTKVIGPCLGETCCLALLWAVLDRASRRLARREHHTRRAPPAARPAPLPARTTTPGPPPHPGHRQRRRERQSHRIT